MTDEFESKSKVDTKSNQIDLKTKCDNLINENALLKNQLKAIKTHAPASVAANFGFPIARFKSPSPVTSTRKRSQTIPIIYAIDGTGNLQHNKYSTPAIHRNQIKQTLDKWDVKYDLEHDTHNSKLETGLFFEEQYALPSYLQVYHNCQVNLVDMNHLASIINQAKLEVDDLQNKKKKKNESQKQMTKTNKKHIIRQLDHLVGKDESTTKKIKTLLLKLNLIQILVIPSVLLIAQECKCSVNDMYIKLKWFEVLYPHVRIFPFICTEEQMEDKIIYMTKLMKTNELIQNSTYRGSLVDLLKQSDVSLQSMKGYFLPTLIIPNLNKFNGTMESLTNSQYASVLLKLLKMLDRESQLNGFNVDKGNYIVKSNNGTRAENVKHITPSTILEVIHRDSNVPMTEESKGAVPLKWLGEGIIIQPISKSFENGEFKLYFKKGQFIKALLTKTDTADAANPFVTFYYIDIQHHHDRETHKHTDYELFAQYLTHFITFCSQILLELQSFDTDVIATTPIIRCDVTFEEIPYAPASTNATYPVTLNAREFAISSDKKIRMSLNEITTSFDIQFASTTHQFPLVPTVAENVKQLIDATLTYSTETSNDPMIESEDEHEMKTDSHDSTSDDIFAFGK